MWNRRDFNTEDESCIHIFVITSYLPAITTEFVYPK